MKDLITTLASIMLLMIFVMQFVANQVTYTRLTAAGSFVREFESSAEEAGEITDGNAHLLKENIAQVMDCIPDEVKIITTVNERENSEYVVSTPLKNIIGAATLLGISEDENRTDYKFKGIILKKSEGTEDEKYDNDHGSDDSVLSAY